MIIDDNDADCILLREAVMETGWNAGIIEALSRQTAINALNREALLATPPDLILLDYWLHRDEAPALIAEIRSIRGYEQLPIIILSCSELRPEQRERCHALGVLKILVKSQHFSGIMHLVRILRKILEGRGDISQGGSWISDGSLAELDEIS
jgi:CheY-like chemotaxis protein